MAADKVAIIGAGPAGIAAAIQLKRQNIEPILLEKDRVGGLLRNANLIENYPGFPSGIPGVGLIGLFERQLENAGIGVNIEEVLEVSLHRRTCFLQTDKRAVTSKILVVAAGTRPKRLKGIPFSEEVEQSLFYEVFPLLQMANKNIAIIGSGDAAFDYGLNLSRRNKVVIIGRRGEVKCIPLLWKRAEENQNISYLADAAINTITRAGKGLLLTRGQKRKDIYADYVVVAIGREPGLDFLRPEVRRSIKRLMNTKVLYLVGDVKNRIYRQTAICVGDGVRAAMEICRRMRA